MPRFDANTATLGQLLEDPEVVAIIEEHAPGLTSNPMIGMAKSMPANQVLGMAGSMIGQDKADAIKTAIESLD